MKNKNIIKKHSRHYQKVKSQISANKYYSLSEAVNFFQNDNLEKLKNIKASFTLNQTNQKAVLGSKITLPYPVGKEKKIVVVKEGLPENVITDLLQIPNVELLSINELQEKITKRKKSQ